jgi:hypothetical protein
MSTKNPFQIQLENVLYPVKFTNNKTIIVNFLTEVMLTFTFDVIQHLILILFKKL